MIHVVSGYFRSGTSAMMQALIAGGMSAAWDEKPNELAAQHADESYHPNRGGQFEILVSEYSQADPPFQTKPNFPLNYQGKLIKVVLWGLDSLAVNPEGYRVVLMTRDPEEIRQSYRGAFGNEYSMKDYQARIDRALAMLRNRRDVQGVSAVSYADMVADPVGTFVGLRSAGWAIDPLESAAVIDPKQYRFRRERLTVGI
jgi:hypothetical protein